MIDQIYMMMIETAKMANAMVLTTRKFKKEYKMKKKKMLDQFQSLCLMVIIPTIMVR